MKRTLKRELKGLEIAKREPLGGSVAGVDITRGAQARAGHRLRPAGQHQLRGRECGWREGERVLGSRLGCLLLQPAEPRAGRATEERHEPRPVPWGSDETGAAHRDDSLLVPRRAPSRAPPSRKRGKDADEMYPIDPS